jgi:hypothetical protein
MARLTSTHRFVEGCEPLAADDIDDIPPVPGFRPAEASCAAADIAPPRPSLLRRHRGLVSTLVGVGVAVGLLGLLVRDVYGSRPPADFSCPPAVSDAVQAATGCRVDLGPDEEE